jgi:dCMP deaminase
MNFTEQELLKGDYLFYPYPDNATQRSNWTYKELTWIESFSKIAKEIATHSTCRRLQVGALVVRENRIISLGYNGTPSGMENCSHHFTDEDELRPDFKEVHGIYSATHEVHAEMNAILFAQKEESKVVGCDLFITTEPCLNCTKLIITAGIKSVYFINKYDRGGGCDLLRECGIPCFDIREIKFNDKPIISLD